ncbi:isoleucine--tRNA ligase, partial [bacterium]
LPYMILDSFVPTLNADGSWDDRALQGQLMNLPEEDQWILSRINSVIRETEQAMTEYQLHQVTRMLMSFILDDLSRWYIQLVRPRMWLEEEAVVKEQAYQCVYYVLRRLSLLLSPFVPHIAEKMYNNLRLPKDLESIHMEDWRAADESMINVDLEAMMAIVRLFDDAVASARQVGKRKLRWPVAECIVATTSPSIKEAVVQLNSICKARANSRVVRVVDAPWEGIIWRPVALMKEVGPTFGRESLRVKELIERSDGTKLKQLLERDGTATLTAERQSYSINTMHVTFIEEVPQGFFSSQMNDATVYVDTSLTPDLEGEGYAREIIRRLQDMRRQLDLRVEDFIVADVAINDTRVCELVRETWAATIAHEVRANDLTLRISMEQDAGQGRWDLRNEWDVDGVVMQ